MRNTLIAAIALAASTLLVPALPASAAYCTTSQIGSYSYTTCSDGSSASSTQIGGYTHTDIMPSYSSPRSSPTYCTSSRIGSYVYTDCR